MICSISKVTVLDRVIVIRRDEGPVLISGDQLAFDACQYLPELTSARAREREREREASLENLRCYLPFFPVITCDIRVSEVASFAVDNEDQLAGKMGVTLIVVLSIGVTGVESQPLLNDDR